MSGLPIRVMYARNWSSGAASLHRQGDVGHVQMSHVRNVIDNGEQPGRGCSSSGLSIVVIDDQLTSPFEQVEQARRPVRPHHFELRIDLGHREAPTLRGDRVTRPRVRLWVGFDGGLARLDEATGEVTAVADVAPGPVWGIAVTDDAVWVRAEGRLLRHIDPATAMVVEDITAPDQSAGSVIVAFGSIWATASDDDALYRIDLQAS